VPAEVWKKGFLPLSLSWRQCFALERLRDGDRVKQIADKLGVTPQAVTDYLFRARVEMGAKTNYQLVAMFTRSPTVRKP
jgi:DNA-binding NarL/FixJ family response regulator